MENHPIPQDVTGFQFRLIGNMTLKQFAYLATGVIFGWLIFSVNLSAFIRVPLAVLSFLVGFSLAFLPLEGRPMDAMLFYFIKSLFSPNQYIFQKQQGELFAFSPSKSGAPASFVPSAIREQPTTFLNKAPQQETTVVSQELPEQPTQETAPIEQKFPEPKAAENLEKQTIPAAFNAAGAQETETQNLNVPEQPGGSVVAREEKNQQYEALLAQMQKTKEEKESLERELATLKKGLASQTQPQEKPLIAPPPPKAQAPIVKKIPFTQGEKPMAAPMPDVPNLIIGIVKDPRGNMLPNILVEVKDTQNNPVRAFKTNGLGQFASATPLQSGVYTVEFDDPQQQHSFDAIELTVTGNIISPIEVTSQDEREKLRKELFAHQQP